MSVLRLLHAADLHLDTPFEGLPENKAAVRRNEQRMLLSALVSEAVSRRVDLVLLPGDLLDSGSIYSETAQLLSRVLNTLPCPVFIAPGNHDFYSDRSPYATLENMGKLHIFRKNKIECIEVPEIGARVFGAAFTDKTCRPLLTGFSAEKYDDAVNIMCVHGEVGSNNGRYNPITEAELAGSGMDYVALGHIHEPSGLRKAGSCSYSWPGCPEGRGFDECGDRYISIVEIDRNTRETYLEQISVASRRCFVLETDITGTEPLLAIHRMLPENTERDIYRVILKGECESAPNLGRLYANLEDMFFHLELRDSTRVATDIWEKAGEDTLRGIFLSKLRDRYDAAESDEARRLVSEAARWGLAALDNGEVPENDY